VRSAVASTLLALLLLVPRAGAHTLPISFLYVVPDADYLHLELMLNPFELSFFSELDANKDGRLDPGELKAQEEQATGRILECLKLQVDGKPVKAEVAGITPEVDGHHLTLRAQYHVDARRVPLQLESSLSTITSGSHLTQVTYLRSGKRQLAQLDTQSAKVTFAAPAEVDRPAVLIASADRSRQTRVAVILVTVLGGAVFVVAGWRSRRPPQSARSAARSI
jgi:hypothetical protein